MRESSEEILEAFVSRRTLGRRYAGKTVKIDCG
jgi:hypothetical protein